MIKNDCPEILEIDWNNKLIKTDKGDFFFNSPKISFKTVTDSNVQTLKFSLNATKPKKK